MSNALLSTTIDKEVLPAGWTWSTLGEQSEKPQYGWTTKANADKGRLKLLRTTDITSGSVDWPSVPYCTDEPDDIEKYMVKSGDVLISRAGSVGVSFLINNLERAVFASYLIRFRPKKDIDTKYFYYYLKSPAYWEAIGASKSGIAVPNVNASKLAEVSIPVAPPDQQKLIVAEIEKQFSRLDEAIADLKRVKANFKRYKAAVLKAAVEGKHTEAWRKAHPDVEPASELLKRILVERRKKWEEAELAKMKAKGKKQKDDGWKKKYKEPPMPATSELPSLPKEWTWVALPQIALFQNGRFFPSKEYSRQGVKLLRPGNLFADGTIRWSEVNTRRMPDTWAKQFPEFLVGGNEIIMNLTAQSLKDEFLGRTCLTNDEDRCLLNQRLARITPLTDINPRFLTLVLKAKRFRNFVDTLNTGSLIQHMFTSDLAEFIFPLPPAKEQVIITGEIDSLLSISEENEKVVEIELSRAERLRQSILRKAFVGELV
jgi:type I restriction enzyme S subunit